jgi:predicted dehydrogenase
MSDWSGYGFMGRTHSNAFSQVNQFFDVPYQPVLKAVCARMRGAAQPSPSNGDTSRRNRLAQAGRAPDIDLIDIASPNDTHAEIAIAAARAGKMVMCEKPLGRNAAEAERWCRGGEGGRAQHGLVQLPARARRDAGQAT